MEINIEICMFYHYEPSSKEEIPNNFLKIIKDNSGEQNEKIKRHFRDLYDDFCSRIKKIIDLNNKKNILVIFPPTKIGKINRMLSWKNDLIKILPNIIFIEIEAPEYEKKDLPEITYDKLGISTFNNEIDEDKKSVLIFIDDIYTKGETAIFCIKNTCKKFDFKEPDINIICMAKKKNKDNTFYIKDAEDFKINKKLNPIYS